MDRKGTKTETGKRAVRKPKRIDSYQAKLEKKPRFNAGHSYRWADYLELLCLANIDGELSKSDIIDRFAGRELDFQEGDPDDVNEMLDLTEEVSNSTSRAEIPDKWLNRANDWFRLLQVRTVLYKESYPFVVSDSEIKRKKTITKKQLVYLFFLSCSNLHLFPKQHQTMLADCFEISCLKAVKNILPAHADVNHFGSNQFNVDTRYGKRTLWKKLEQLTKDICENLKSTIKRENHLHMGDSGLDILGLIDTGDKLPSRLIFFGQCTCQEKWWDKQSEASFEEWGNKIQFHTRFTSMTFIPFCYRDANAEWIDTGKLAQSFLVDRNRLMYYLDGKFEGLKKLPAYNLVQTVISAKESIF